MGGFAAWNTAGNSLGSAIASGGMRPFWRRPGLAG
nr:hypothetical protein [Meiothermus sp.]